MKIEGVEEAKSTKPVTIQMLKDRSAMYRKTPSVEIYINSVLEQM